MKKIMITGVAGMIGSHLADELLARGCHVIGVDNLSVGKRENIAHNLKNPRFTFKKLDVLDFNKLERSSRGIILEGIFHLTASKKISESGDSLEVLQNNVKGTENLLRLAKEKKCKFILGSTSDVYGMSRDLPFREDGNLLIGPSTAKRWTYAVSKLFCEQLAFAYYKEYKVPIVVLRYFGGFSPRASFSWRGGHIPVFIDAVLLGHDLIVHGDGTQTRSMAYISDIIDGTVRAFEKPKAVGQIFNIGNDQEINVIDTANLIKQLARVQSKSKIRFVPFESIFGDYQEIQRRVPDLTKARNILGYRPKVSLEQGLLWTIEQRKQWLRNNENSLRRKDKAVR